MSAEATGHAEGSFAAFVERAVLRWVRWYTSDLDPAVRDDRLAELTADLWDHRSTHGRDGADIATGANILGRALRGIPGDLAWRRDELTADTTRGGISAAWTRSGTLVMSYLIMFGVFVFAAASWTRILLGAFRGSYLPSDGTLFSLLVGAIALVCGVVLLRQTRHRWIAALWIGFGTVLQLHFGFVTLVTLSTSFYAFVDHASLTGASSFTSPLVWVALGGTGIFFVALAIAWVPNPTEPTEESA